MPVVTAEGKAFADEYEKNPELLTRDLKQLRDWLKTQRHLPEVKDELLLHFFHSCFYDLKNTKDCIESYFVLRTNSPDIFSDRDVTKPELAKALQSVYMFMLPEPAPDGYLIVYNGLRDPDPAKFKYLETNKLAFMAMDAHMETHPPNPGTILVVNMQGSKMAHLTKVSLSVARRSLEYQQEGNPIRLKAIHIINVVSWIDKAMALIRPFIKKDLLELLHFHTHGIESLYEFIPKECLPKDLGGSQKSLEELQADFVTFMRGMNEFYLEQEALKVDESKREKKIRKKKNNPIATDIIMFNKLELD